MELVEEDDPVLDRLLIEGLQDHVAGPVGGVTGPLHRRLAELPGVAAELALGDLALGRPGEGQAHMLEFVDRLDDFMSEGLGDILIGQVVTPLDGVEGVPLGPVLADVAERRPHPPLSGPRMRAGGVELA